MDKIVRRITVIQLGGKGAAEVGSADTVYKKKGKKRKNSKGFSPFEKLARRVLKARKVFADEMLDRHERQSRKRKDGWLREAPRINLKAGRKAFKKLVND